MLYEELSAGIHEDDGLLAPEDVDVLARQGVADLVAHPLDVYLTDLVDLPELIAGPTAVRPTRQSLRPHGSSNRGRGLHRGRC